MPDDGLRHIPQTESEPRHAEGVVKILNHREVIVVQATDLLDNLFTNQHRAAGDPWHVQLLIVLAFVFLAITDQFECHEHRDIAGTAAPEEVTRRMEQKFRRGDTDSVIRFQHPDQLLDRGR